MPHSSESRYSLSDARSLLLTLESMLVIMSTTWTLSTSSPSASEVPLSSELAPTSIEVMSSPVLWISSGYSDSVSSSTLAM